MITLTTEQAQQIEEALLNWKAYVPLGKVALWDESDEQALSIIRAARAQEQAEQEPVACPHGVDDGACKECYMEQTDYFDYGLEEVEDYLRNCCNNNFMADKLSDIRKSSYAAPVRTKDLTDEEILVIANMWEDEVDELDFARPVIAKFKEKNNANNNPRR